MLVDGQYLRNVGYVVAVCEEGHPAPKGTVFFVSQSLGPGFGCVYYAVTCCHVLKGIQGNELCGDMFLRVNDRHGVCEDIPTYLSDWVIDQENDVAVSPVDFPPKISMWAYPIESTRPPFLMAGHEVFSVGLFVPLPGFKSVQAIVRCGQIARPSVKVPILSDPSGPPVQEVNVHLVEFRSWGGESGSPVFLYEEAILIPNSDLRPDLPAATIALADLRASDVQPRLLGMLHGHFDAHGRDENSGIAAVIPFEAIAEILRCNSLEVERNRILEERQRLAVRAPIPDCAH